MVLILKVGVGSYNEGIGSSNYNMESYGKLWKVKKVILNTRKITRI
jgi:hypothetical protein